MDLPPLPQMQPRSRTTDGSRSRGEEPQETSADRLPNPEGLDGPQASASTTHRPWRPWEDGEPSTVPPPPTHPAEPAPRPIAPAPLIDAEMQAKILARLEGPAQPALLPPSARLLYNPYPYERTWEYDRVLAGDELKLWHKREDRWTTHSFGGLNICLVNRLWSTWIGIIREKQAKAKKDWEEGRIRDLLPALPPPEPDAEREREGTCEFAGEGGSGDEREGEGEDGEEDDGRDPQLRKWDLELKTAADGQKGVSMQALLAGRRAIARALADAKTKVFENYHRDNIWVRIKWPAYPDHEPARSILVTFRYTGRDTKRRPCTRLELTVALAALVTRYYDEVSAMEPHPAFQHLALGKGEGRISLYGLRMMGLRATPKAIFDLELELDSKEEEGDAQGVVGDSETMVRTWDPPWASCVPVPTILAPPPKLTPDHYFRHVDPISMSQHALPVWHE